jgi:kinesin family protein 1
MFCLAGFNVSIFAYGQTGSGKSYSMLGYGEDKGLIPRVCDEMFKRVEKLTSQSPDVTVQIEVSFMEIYNEMVFDLLNPSSAKKGGLKVRNHPKTGPYVDNLSRLAVNVYPEIEELMDEGSKSRTVASTNMNAQSSRSHAVFTILLTQQKVRFASSNYPMGLPKFDSNAH